MRTEIIRKKMAEIQEIAKRSCNILCVLCGLCGEITPSGLTQVAVFT